MSLLRKLFHRKPPDGLLEISERVYVFDCCFTTDALGEEDFKVYVGGIISQLRDHCSDASFLVFNFREEGTESQTANVFSEYDMTVMDYPRQYEGCPLLTIEVIHHFLRSCESWLSLGQHNVLLMHCERGGWPVLAFILAALLIYRKLYTGEQKTLDMIYKQAPRELLQLLSPLNPLPSQLRYLQYVSRRNVATEWPPLDRALTFDCIMIRFIPNFDGEGGCRPIFRIYGQDPFLEADRTPKVLFSTQKKSKAVRLYKQAESEVVKIDIGCHVQGDVVLECINLHDDMAREEMMFRVMFNTAFIRSNILILNRDEIDMLWHAKDQFPKDFRAEVLFSEMDSAAASLVTPNLSCFDEEGLPMEAFAKVQEIFQNVDWLDPKADAALNVLQQITASNIVHEDTDSHLVDELRSSLQELKPQKLHEKKHSAALEHHNEISALMSLENLPLPSPKLSPNADANDRKSITQDVQVAQEQPIQSDVIGRWTLESSLVNPASCNSVQVSSVPVPREGIASADLGISHPMHDHASLESAKFTYPVTASPALLAPTLDGSCTPKSAETGDISILPPPPPPSPQQPSLTASAASLHATTTPAPPPPPPPPPQHNLSATKPQQFSVSKQPEAYLQSGNQPSLVSCKPLHGTLLLGTNASDSSSHLPSSPPGLKLATSTPPAPPTPPPPPTPPLKETRSVRAGPPPPPPPPRPSGEAASPTVSSLVRPPPPPPAPPTPSSVPSAPPPPSSMPSAPPPPSSVPSAPPPPVPFDKGFPKTGVVSPGLLSAGSNKDSSISGTSTPRPPLVSPSSAKGRILSRTISSRNHHTKKLKPLHWLKLTRAVQGSLWAEAQKSGEATKAPEIDMSELESLFAAAIPNSEHGKSGGKSTLHGSLGHKSDKVQLIDHRRAYNCEIMLSKVKMPLHELMGSVLSLEESALDIDQVDNLIKFCPTKEEIELLKGYNGDKDKLGKCEQFFLELMQVPRAESKLRVFSFKIQFCSQVSDLRNNLNTVNAAAEEIRNSLKLKRVMQTILSLGNALNQGTARGSAIGFRLDSLLKLTDMRARNKKMTLMHYLCKVLADKLPELIDFSKDLISLEPASKIQLKVLAEEMQAISKGLEKVIQELSISENDGQVSENFCKALKEFLRFAEAEVRSLASLYSGVGRNVDALILYFGEDPSRCTFEQVVSTLLNFVRMFSRAHEENCKQLELEKKKAEKEAEVEKLKMGVSQERENISHSCR
ncbi:formin-like protein 18 [Malania oleifera]|uniref:formin-like protein 18 n=1 Tax=Malania oleifera TaxID=397392 RepID=UPI0025AE54BB|nr:formin-like protein 18 [Malania oleifera]